MSAITPASVRLEVAAIVASGLSNADGFTLYSAILPHLRAGHKVILSLANAPAFTSSFLNSSLGTLADEFGLDLFKGQLAFTDYRAIQAEQLRAYVAGLRAQASA